MGPILPRARLGAGRSPLDRAHIDAVIGRVTRCRLREIWNGVRLVLEPDPA